MCGIFGYNNKYDSNKNNIFLDSMRYRGPDAENIKSYNDWNLGHQRLSIIDSSASANQPMEEDDNIIVFNGEIYNFIELKKKYLPNIKTKTNSDTEILILLLSKYGEKIINELNGMFAFAWYNKTKKELLLCRDRFGVKPLHWMKEKNIFYFSSELKPLLKIKGGVKFNEAIISAFVIDTASDFNEQTFAKDIFQLEPGHLLKVKSNKIKIKRWYQGTDYKFNKNIFSNRKKTINLFEDLLTDAIKIRHRSDVPICITLSGGLDSTLIYTLAKEKLNSNIKPFTFIHPGAGSNEHELARRISQEYGDELITITNDKEHSIEDIKETLKILEFPIWNPSGIAYLDVYKKIKNSGYKVVLEGHGSDEQLGGYPYMAQVAHLEHLQNKNFINAFTAYKTYWNTLNPALNQKANSRSLIIGFIKSTISYYSKQKKVEQNTQKTIEESFNYKILPIVLRAFDRLSMSQSIESRCPFMDFRLVELTKSLPISYKIGKIGNKAILRYILKKYKKDYIYKNKKKTGFALDLSRFMNNKDNKKYFTELINRFNIKKYKNLKKSALKKVSKNHILYNDIEPIWKIASLQITKEQYDKI